MPASSDLGVSPMRVPSSVSSLCQDGFSCQELVMRLKTETLIDANGMAVVFKDIQDNKREMLVAQRCDQRCGNGCRISLSTSLWCCQDVSEYGDPMRRDESVCSTSGDNPFSFIGAKVHALCEEISGKSAPRVLRIQVLQCGQI